MILQRYRKNLNNISEKVEKLKTSDVKHRELFIEEYIPFIIKSITLVTHSYVNVDNDEEFSIGLEAFNEAIDKYDKNKGNFLSFAQLLIKNKLIDYKRKEKSKKIVLVDNVQIKEMIDSVHSYEKKDISSKIEIKEQIKILEVKLKEFDITYLELTLISPKHVDTRLNCIKAAKTLKENKDLLSILYNKKVIPVKHMIKLGFSKKFLKRNRKFIIATTIILNSDLEYIKNYVYMVEGKNGNGVL